MEKKVTTVYISSDILKKAKKEIPNISGFVEECLRVYMGIGDENITSIQDELNKIKDSQLKIHLLSENDFTEPVVKEFDNRKCNEVWLRIWATYRNTEAIIDSDIHNASTVLNKSYDYLKNMMEDLLLYVPKSDLAKCDDWNTALKEYERILNDY